MKKNLIATLLFVFLAIPVFAHEVSTESAAIIHMDEGGFHPEEISILRCGTVEFENAGTVEIWPASNIHPTHEIYSEFDPLRPIPPGESWKFTFDKPGIWQFHDHLNPRQGGKILVDIVYEGSKENCKEQEKNAVEKKIGWWRKFLTAVKEFWTRVAVFFGNNTETTAEKKEPNEPETENMPMDPKNREAIAEVPTQTFSPSPISKNSSEIFHDYEKLYSYIYSYNPKQTLTRLKELEGQFGSCHETAHYVGRFSYELYDTEAFKLCDMVCQSGCYHGAVEAFFKSKGTANLAENLRNLCSDDLGGFVKHQCLHGMGHGLMAWTNYELFDALESCDLLENRNDETSCYTGVYMENIVQSMAEFVGLEGHVTEYLSDDPHYPCNIVDVRYKPECYFLQTDRMMQLYGGDFAKISEICEEVEHSHSRRLCFESMGRTNASMNRGNQENAIKNCLFSSDTETQSWCVRGTVQDSFWDPTGQDTAIAFCEKTPSELKNMCYSTIFERAREILPPASRAVFCAKIEEEYKTNCPQ